jgi:hypothetical protein
MASGYFFGICDGMRLISCNSASFPGTWTSHSFLMQLDILFGARLMGPAPPLWFSVMTPHQTQPAKGRWCDPTRNKHEQDNQ